MSDVLRPGQTHRIVRAQIIIDDGSGNAHAWEVVNGTANWDFTGVGLTGRSTARVVLDGEFRRRTKQIPQQREEIE